MERALDHLQAQEMAAHSAKVLPVLSIPTQSAWECLKTYRKLNQAFGQGTGAKSPRSGFLHMLLT